MKKSRKFLYTLLAALLIFCVVIAVACEPPADPDEGTDDDSSTTTTDTAAINNGTFATATGASSAYVKTNVTGWSIATDDGSWKNTAAGLMHGVVDLNENIFSTNKNAINAQLVYPGIAPNTPKKEGGEYADTNALVISMSADESYGSIFYSASKTATIAQGKYYKLTIDVRTDLIFDEDDTDMAKRGATLVIGDDVYVEYLSINTEQRWQTYEIYLEGNNYEDRTISIQLWLGHGPSTLYDESGKTKINPYLAKGTVMFDNVVLTELATEDGVCAEYEAALNENFEAICPDAAKESTDISRALNVNVGRQTVVSLVYPDVNFTAYRPYDAGTTNTSYIKPYYTAKVGDSANYTWVLGKEGLEDDEDFPDYTTISNSYQSYSSDPRGIFDMSKLYSFEKDDDNNLVPTDTFNKLSTSFTAPAIEDFYNPTTGAYNLTYGANPLDSKALLIYHLDHAISGAGYVSDYNLLVESNKYYEVSVWVYIWVPAIDAPEEPEAVEDPGEAPKREDFATDEEYETALETYNEKLDAYNKYLDEKEVYDNELSDYNAYMQYVNGDEKVYATFRLSGATTDTKLEQQSDGSWGSWQQLTIKVKGNELADRQLQLEFWYGEGEWGEDTLYPGGCFFDSLTIKEYTEVDDEAEYEPLSVLYETDYAGFGLTPDAASPEFTAIDAAKEGEGWRYAMVDDKTSSELVTIGKIGGTYAYDTSTVFTDPALAGMTAPGTFAIGSDKFDVVMLRHNDYTATTLTFMPAGDFMVVKPNHFYRLSMWVNTVDLASGSTFKVSVYDKETEAVVNSSAAVSSIAVGEWTEISLLFKGSATTAKELYLYFEFGSGDIYTPASHTKGTVFVTACTFTEVDYTEYNTASSGTYVKKVSLTETSSSTSSVTNGDFSSISDSNYSDDDDEIFDAEGNITGVAGPSSWTSTSAANALGTVSVSVSGTTLSWNRVNPEVTAYYVYMNSFRNEDGTREDGVLVGKVLASEGVEDGDNVKYTFTATANRSYYVRAVAEVNGKIYTSAASTTKSVSGVTGTEQYVRDTAHEAEAEAIFGSAEAGVINYEKYTGLIDEERNAFYFGAGDSMAYRSTSSKNLLMITSAFETYFGYKSASSTLSANSYYRLSVWVKTDGGKASVTLANNSNALTINRNYDDYNAAEDGEYVGYVNIDTAGKWVRYDFYIATNMSSATLNLELYLGNKYGVTENALGTDEDATKVSYGLSSGTVYFDDVMLVKLDDEAAYNKLVYGIDNADDITAEEIATLLKDEYGIDTPAEDVAELTVADIRKARENKAAQLSARGETASYYTNNYIFKVVEYYTDSFDNYEDKTDDGSYLGYTPASYTHHNASGAESGTDDEPNIVYGVYDKTKIEDAFVSYLCSEGYALADFGEEAVRNFLTANLGDSGNNMYLLLANVQEAAGQYYQSSSFSMSATSYYKITFKAKLLANEGTKAEFRLVYDNTNGYWETLYIDPGTSMLEYTFYYYNESASSHSIYLNYTLGSNDAQGDADKVENYVVGMLAIDDVTITKLEDGTEYDAAVAAVENGSAVRTGTYKTEAAPADDGDEGDGDEGGEDKGDGDKEINPQVWLIISSVVIGVILIAVIVILSYRKLKDKVSKKLRKTKVESKVPVDIENKQIQAARKSKDRKKDITSDEYNDD
ncbi:MAG: hypothetical protein IAB16_01395 [Firmicutes bacterium]|uniref:Uncharacterized protein n=1 Tax=Candidatus Stercoripulliclostridium pullicola TaxID=2840953 RepID=A0A940DFZ8_9FIRM|nr:hypothetical protein [Candidatus Stercoripulliclostridium pullicola]